MAAAISSEVPAGVPLRHLAHPTVAQVVAADGIPDCRRRALPLSQDFVYKCLRKTGQLVL